MSKHIEIFEKVTLQYDHDTGTLYVEDYDEGEQLVIFKVVENE